MKRSKWKGVYVKPKNYKEALSVIKPSRNSSIIPQFIGQTVKIYTGKTYRELIVTKEMLGHKFGEFAKTRADFVFKKKKKKKK